MNRSTSFPNWIKFTIVAACFCVIVTVLMLWLAGRFSPKIPTVVRNAPSSQAIPAGGSMVKVQSIRRPVFESAVGSIRAVYETAVSSRIAARVLEVNMTAGKRVVKGDVLVKLDDTDLKARLQQSGAAVESAGATLAHAEADEKRFKEMLSRAVATQGEYDRSLAALKSAQADRRRAEQSVIEAQSMLDYATIKAPMDGIIVDKKIQPGDIVLPGTPMAILYDPNHMQLVASVRESLAYRLKVGQEIGVKVDVLDKLCSGKVSEIVPESQSSSRTFQVKVTGPCPPNMYSGMFGRILIPLEEEQIVVIPVLAVHKIGQLELVDVADGTRVVRRAVRTGRIIEGQYEILSGLAAGELVIADKAGEKKGA